jgi:hypothetical protein
MSSAAKHTPAEIASAKAVVAKIELKVDDLLAPLAREMRIMRWAPAYRAILWEAVMLEAQKRATVAHGEIAEEAAG